MTFSRPVSPYNSTTTAIKTAKGDGPVLTRRSAVPSFRHCVHGAAYGAGA